MQVIKVKHRFYKKIAAPLKQLTNIIKTNLIMVAIVNKYCFMNKFNLELQ